MAEEIKDFRFECKRCGKCCTDKNTLVNVTYLDILRIKNALNLNFEELKAVLGFYVMEEQITEENARKLVLTPLKTERGMAYIGLLKKPSGACYFYDEVGKRCKIYPDRPMFCRTFPFTFQLLLNKNDKTRGKIKMGYAEKAKEYCVGISRDSPKIDERQWIEIGKITIEEMNANAVLLNNWNVAVKEGKIRPLVDNFLLLIFQLEEDPHED